jgi:hypothetical protein
VTRIAVEVLRRAESRLDLRYRIDGDIGALAIPPLTSSTRCDRLWEHLCVEAFVRGDGTQDYREINAAPSTAWAVYHFSGYRAGMADALVVPPAISVDVQPDCLELTVSLTLDLSAAALWHIGLSAVIEDYNGHKSCWALRHPPGKADFHHAHGFALPLSGPVT